MRTFFNGLLLGLIVGAGTLWYYVSTYTIPDLQAAEQAAHVRAGRALQSAHDAAEKAKQALTARLDALDLSPEEIRKDLAATGRVVRQRARDLGEVVADAVADAQIRRSTA
jgi:hypothetical protein